METHAGKDIGKHDQPDKLSYTVSHHAIAWGFPTVRQSGFQMDEYVEPFYIDFILLSII